MARERGIANWLKGQKKNEEVLQHSSATHVRKSGLHVPKGGRETEREHMEKQPTSHEQRRGKGFRRLRDAIGRPLRNEHGERRWYQLRRRVRLEVLPDGREYRTAGTKVPMIKRRAKRRAHRIAVRKQRQMAMRAGRPMR